MYSKPRRSGAPGRKGKSDWTRSKRLEGALFIHAKDGCLLRRLQIKTDDSFGFGAEMGVVARQVSALPMRLEASGAPDFLHRVEADPVTPRHQTTRPMTPASRWPHPQGVTENALLLGKAHPFGPSGARPIDQGIHPRPSQNAPAI
jgi:hypothetical protein